MLCHPRHVQPTKSYKISSLRLLKEWRKLTSDPFILDIVQNIKVLCDNTTAVNYVNNMGGIVSEKGDSVSLKTWEWENFRPRGF
ncbi:hypothetical protein MAR_012296 [Mya arenaria]|uniref:Uncharacterized protein n=1 Tax=Mya arenaria TaxID=6604 RepID=A0ABY7FZW9_MYAAR|nr:hypothetical protein MAR_012296 [Mya arenaria]